LHIEQGPHLDASGIDIGIVEKIAAPAAFRLILKGTGGHAGAVLMPERHDAFLAAAEIALAVEKAALESPSIDTVGTVGKVEVRPGAINSIPNHTLIEIDFRDTDLAARDAAIAEINATAEGVCQRRGVALEWQQINADPPAICDPDLVALIESTSTAFGYTHQRMISRAYHDSLFMARLCPTTMIFIPCDQGYSHRPDEYSSPEAIAKGTSLLAETLRQLSSR
jgi:ureidoglycolate amidohydrolase